MYRGETVAVVVPAYNEAGLVGHVLDTVPGFVDAVYAVDDRSTDGTWAEIRERADSVAERQAAVADGGDAARSPPVTAIRHDENRGVGAAIKTGYRRALADGMDVVAVMNGDGQMDPAILDRIVDPVATGRAGYAKGDRLTQPECHGNMSRWRLFGNRVLTGFTRVASGYWRVTDSQNGYTAISADALRAVDLDELYDRYGFLNDLLVHLNVAGVSVTDVPMRAVYADESSSIRYRTFVPGLSGVLLRGFLRRVTTRYVVERFHPLVVLYALGGAGIGVAGAVGAWSLAAADATLLGLGVTTVVLLAACTALALAMAFDAANAEDAVAASTGTRRSDRAPRAYLDSGEDRPK